MGRGSGAARRLAVLTLVVALAARQAAARDFYGILGVAKDADDRTIKRAYKKQALKWHPDRHAADKKQAEDKFKDIAAAYETLTDPEKRRLYDQFGEEGLKGGGPGGGPGGPGGGFQFHGDPFEMFNMFFGGGGGGGGRQFHFGGGGGGGQQFHFGGGGGGFPGGGMGGGFPGGGMGGGMRGGHGRGGGGGGGLYDGDSNVEELDAASFPQGGASNNWVWLVEFYAPWCGHCQQLAPKWSAVAKALKGVVKVAAVNCDVHKAVCSAQGVQGYPTIKALAPGSSRWQEYAGDRGAKALSDWATGLIGSAVTSVRKEAELAAFLGQCGGAGAKRGAKGGSAAWGVCLLLLSDKGSVPSLWKALSVAFKGKAALGFVGPDAKAVLSELGPAAAGAKVVTVCNGDLRTAEAYAGALKSAQLQRHISGYASGSKCAAQVVLDASTDLAKMKVSQLKTLIAAKGVDCTGCLEKADYVGALQRWLREQQAGGGGAKQEL